MKFVSSMVIVALLTAAYSINASPLGKRSLNILKYLEHWSYPENKTLKIDCLVENATSYHWYKDYVTLTNDDPSFNITGNILVIKKFTKSLEGYYMCLGKNEKGNTGETEAYLSLKDPCALPTEKDTWCSDFDAKKCLHLISDYPTKAENLNIEVQADVRVKPWPDIWFLVSWTVPMQGRSNIWGWQIQIIGMSKYSLGYNQCYQINQKYTFYPPLKEIIVTRAFPVPYSLSTYVVEVKSLPHLTESEHPKFVVQKQQETPGRCELRNIKACCDSYTNVTLMSKDSRATLKWTTYYPESLNVTIDAFVLTWWSDQLTSENCSTENNVFLDPAKSNYTFQDLTSKCGKNYTIELKVQFTNNATILGCDSSQPEVVVYQAPEPEPQPSAASTEMQKKSTAIATVGFTIAAILGGIAIAALIYIYVKKKKGDSEQEAVGMENGKIDHTRITSSSFWTGLPPEEGRLNGTSCWSAGENDKYQWIEVDLCKETVVTAIATQGRKSAEEWVVSYAVSYSLDQENFKHFKINEEIEMFNGNCDKNTVVTNVLSPPITARYIRIHPQSWYNHISMRMEVYGSARPQISKGDVSVFILNSNHCDRCIQVVHALAALLMATGHIHCEVDIFAPMQKKSKGLAQYTQEMIFKCDYVIIPWMCEINLPKEDITCKDMNTLIFLSSLDVIHAELVRNRNKKDKYIPVCLDHCQLDLLPAMQVHLPIYNIPSRINDLVVELLGRKRLLLDSKRPLLEFADDNYKFATKKLEQAVNSCHKKSGAKNGNEKQNGVF